MFGIIEFLKGMLRHPFFYVKKNIGCAVITYHNYSLLCANF